MNWRDIENPSAGGAEIFTSQIGKRLVKAGNDVTVFASSFQRCESETQLDGVTIIRDGGKYSVYRKARNYLKHNLSGFDIIVDEINTVPFRVQKLSKGKPVVAVIHQLAREVWFYETRFPINLVGYHILEPLWLRAYRRVPTITVSDSTRKDLEELSFQHLHVIHNGITAKPLTHLPKKDSKPVLIFVGRLVRSKLPDHAIRAFKSVRAVLPDAELWILGDGYLRVKLERESPQGVRFFGRVSEELKFDLLERAHVLLVPSVREGWGISVIEANAVGTPAVGYAVHGLTDSIVNGVTGFVTPAFDPDAMSEAVRKVISDNAVTQQLSSNALEWSKKFNWDNSAREFYAVLESSLNA